jgi:PAS domain S-box-containing protein
MSARILIVDDDAVTLEALSSMVAMRMEGITIDTCESGEAALRHIDATDYDAIVSDIKMPGMNGLELMEEARKLRPVTPTLLISGHGDDDFGIRSLQCGAYAFIKKPIDRNHFVAWLKRAIEFRHLSRELEDHNAKLEGLVRERTAELERINEALLGTLDTLRESERRHRHLVHALPAAVYTCDAEGHVMLYNDAAVGLWGRVPEIGKDLWCGSWKIYEPDGTPMALETCPMALAMRSGRPVRGKEIVIERPDGGRSHVLPYPDPILNASGAVVGAVNMLVDLTERKRVETAIGEAGLANERSLQHYQTQRIRSKL